MTGSGIYLISNLTNDKSYVGSTGRSVGFLKRWRYHVQDLNAGRHGNSHLQAAWNKYGADNIGFMVLEKCGDSELLRREVFWVNRLDSMNPKKGYNLVSPDRRIISAHTRAKMGLARRGVPLKTGHRNKIAEALMGNANALGHRHSEETRNKIRIAATGRASKLRGTKSPHTTKMLIARHAMRRAAYKKSAQFKVFKSFFYSGWSFQDIAYSFGRTTAWAWKVAKRYNLKREIA